MTDTRYTDERPDLGGLRQRSFIVGGVAAVLLLIGAFLDVGQFFRSYLIGWLVWVGVAVGGLALALLHQLTGGVWGMVTRRMFEAAARTMPIVALLFIPMAFGMPAIYEWARPEVVAEDALIQYKTPWLNVPFFLIRTALYLGLWSFIAYGLSRRTMELESRLDDPEYERRVRQFAAFSLLLVVLSVTFAGFDWIMTLEPHWFSSIFGAVVGMSMLVGAFAFAIIMLASLRHREPLESVVSGRVFNDHGSLLLAFLMVWGYLSLSQLLIIWSANIPEEVTWYLHRSGGGWQFVNVALVVFHFAVPFVVLLSQVMRRNPRTLQRLAALVFFMYVVHMFWLVKPSYATEGFALHWLDVVAPIAIGGIWVAFFIGQYLSRPLLPRPAVPRLQELAAEAAHGH